MRKFQIALLLIIATVIFAAADDAFAQKPVKDESLRKGETRATLEPRLFMDPIIRRAYQVAKEIPWVLDSIFCYCYCEDPPFKHKSLLSCYVDDHAVMWDICLKEALRASELYKKGYSVKKIKEIVEKEYKR